jgi:hypothetical protein
MLSLEVNAFRSAKAIITVLRVHVCSSALYSHVTLFVDNIPEIVKIISNTC